ncbi:MAG: prepilin-type N-terminal cleavage/methylation domain-containing protein [Deltaproteobacteria bacterium]|nr:prepilin-type N-terminal cleavage/methylation domain-containing protein [Deltaproteobacteria bacterium]
MPDSNENGNNGFTLVELLIAMALAMVIIASLATTFVSQRKAYDVQEQILEMTQSARAAMDMMSREIRMAGYNPTGSMQTTDPTAAGFVGIPYSATQLAIIADLNQDGETDGTVTDDDANEEITYTFDSTNKQIDRDTGGGPQPLAENIQSFTFEYYDSNGNTTTTAADVRQIDITITVRTSEPDPDYGQNSGYRTYTLNLYVTPPNLDF